MAAVAGGIGDRAIPVGTSSDRKVPASKKERCLKEVHFYQRKFPNVPTLSSEQLLENRDDYLIVDARTRAERNLSMIPGAIFLREFEEKYKKNAVDDKKRVVVYCTIGYRSGMEATRLQHRYPELRGKIYNLDGIVAYTLAVNEEESPLIENESGELKESTTEMDQQPITTNPLIEPSTEQPTNRVHTFGPMWDFTNDSYEAKHFSIPVLAVRLLQVGTLALVRTLQRAVHCTRHCCKAD